MSASEDLAGDVLGDLIAHVEACIDGKKPTPTRVMLVEFYEDTGEDANVELFGGMTQSREEAIGLFAETLMTLGAVIQHVNAKGAH